MFARVQVPGSAPYTAMLIPDVAIGSEQARKFVYVVRPDDTVAQKYVTLGPLDNGDRVIKTGLEATDRVIVDGLMRAKPGIKVTPQTGATKPPVPGTAQK
jgi:multidrug efflux pump subunit AcrA (membrane-fusion protein)